MDALLDRLIGGGDVLTELVGPADVLTELTGPAPLVVAPLVSGPVVSPLAIPTVLGAGLGVLGPILSAPGSILSGVSLPL